MEGEQKKIRPEKHRLTGMMKKIITVVFSNLVPGVVGALAGTFVSIQYGLRVWVPEQITHISPGCGIIFGALTFIIIAVLFFGVIGFFLGGIIGITLFHIIQIILKKKRRVEN